MRTRVSQVNAVRWGVVGSLALLAVGCHKRYREPPPEQPHALLKYRTYYAMVHPGSLEEWIRIDGKRVPPPKSKFADARKRMDIVRLELGPKRLSISSRFSTTVTTHGPQGQGTAVVNLGECGQSVYLVAREGAAYFLDYTYHGPSSCELECMEQVFSNDGKLWTWRPCQVGYEPPK